MPKVADTLHDMDNIDHNVIGHDLERAIEQLSCDGHVELCREMAIIYVAVRQGHCVPDLASFVFNILGSNDIPTIMMSQGEFNLPHSKRTPKLLTRLLRRQQARCGLRDLESGR
jgi:hypothetical protein